MNVSKSCRIQSSPVQLFNTALLGHSDMGHSDMGDLPSACSVHPYHYLLKGALPSFIKYPYKWLTIRQQDWSYARQWISAKYLLVCWDCILGYMTMTSWMPILKGQGLCWNELDILWKKWNFFFIILQHFSSFTNNQLFNFIMWFWSACECFL